MKIKNILHAAALRFCLLVLALGSVSLANAYDHNEVRTGNFDSSMLEPITSLYIAADQEFDKNSENKPYIKSKTYYDTNWYKYGGNRPVSGSGNEANFDWKVGHAVVFKLAKGIYRITVNYSTASTTGGIWVYSGETHYEAYDREIGFSQVGAQGSYTNYVVEDIEVYGPEVWRVSAADGSTNRLHSIKVEKTGDIVETAPELAAITSPYFWYYNGGGSFSDAWGKYNNGTYRYLPHKNDAGHGEVKASCSTSKTSDDIKYVYINGEAIGGDNGSAGGTEQWGSYVFQYGDAIGFKLDPGKDYRIKVYLADRGSEVNNRVLYRGVNVETATRVDANVYQQDISVMENGAPKSTDTRLVTYEINKANAGVYWIKNGINDDSNKLYIGGFEVLPKNYPGFADVFTGESWYVKDNSCTPVATALSSTLTVDYPVSGNNVVIYGPAMATNTFSISGSRSVMLNNGSKFGVSLKKGAKLTFTIGGDSGANVNITDKDGKQLKEIAGSGGYKEVEYTAPSNQEIWITGSSEKYFYFSGFKVEQPEEVAGPLDAAKAIKEDYVWYPVDRGPFTANALIDDYVYVETGFQVQSGKTNIYNKTFTLYNKPHFTYRTGGGTKIGFKVAAGKKGVINLYYFETDKTNINDFQFFEGSTRVTPTSHKENDEATIYQYYFDNTNGGEKTYWLARDKGDVWFGGFEVLFDVGKNNGLHRYKDYTYTVTDLNTEEITNALSDDKYTAVNESPVYGPAMIIRQPATDKNGVVLFKRGDVRNAIVLTVTDGCKYLNVTGYLDGAATIRIYKGTPSDTNKKYVEVTGSGAIDKTVSLEELGDISGPYYITSDNAAGAYLTSVTPKAVQQTFTELQPTDVNYIYKVDGVPASTNNGVQNSGDCQGRIKFIDENGSASTEGNPQMNVVGEKVTPVTIENGTDFFGVKVDEGPGGVKTGYIKVYFNGGNSGNHILQELPLDDPMYAGWNSSYDRDAHIITFTGGEDSGGRGWWLSNEGRDLSKYNKLNIEVSNTTASADRLQVVVQSANGASVVIPYDGVNKRFLGDLTDTKLWHDKNGATFDINHVTQIYIQDTTSTTDSYTSTVELKSARLMNKPIVVAKGSDETNPATGYNEVFGGKIYNLDGGYVYEYPFDLDKVGNPAGGQLIWITGAGSGTINIAAVEVIYDSQHAKVVDWYVNKDTKMIVGSDDPNFKITYLGKELTYPSGYDEYVTFYMSSGRQANVSFIMPEAVREVHDWELAKKEGGDTEKTYGKHTIQPSNPDSDINNYNPKKVKMESGGITYDRAGATGKLTNGVWETTSIKDKIYSWYGYSYNLPAPADKPEYKDDDFWAATAITATQKKDGSEETDYVDGKLGQWKIYMRFISYKAPVAKPSGNNVTVATGQDGYDIYYTLDSSDPENYGQLSTDDKNRSATDKYTGSVDVTDMNCIFKAAQYIDTPFEFYEDISKGKDSERSKVLKVVSKDCEIINEIPSVVYVKNKTLDDNELFNEQKGGYMLTIPTGDKIDEASPYEQKYNANPLMYLTLGGKDRPYLNGNAFNVCGTDWVASDDSGLRTYLDSYHFKMDSNAPDYPTWWASSGSQNNNSYTECNGGPGGADTENGGMFLQPIAGTMLRFEPEYDGVITVWLRQNGCLDNNSQENGKFARRPVYVMDENGRIMRRSTIRPTAEHYMGINGTWSINSSVCEERSQVEHTWLYEVAQQAFASHPLYSGRFNDGVFPNRWETLSHDHSGHILYGWWYKGFDLDATRYRITSADHVSRFEYMEPQLLYRSDKIYDMEINGLGLTPQFAKYGYELPNFQYVRYRIPVKAGKTYYIAGRGTKNGFSAIRFDALAPNTNLEAWKMNDLRYTDNPVVVENPDKDSKEYLKISYDWTKNGVRNHKDKTSKSPYDLTGKTETEVKDQYNTVPTLTIYDTGNGNGAAINSHVYENGKLVGMDEYDLGNLVGKTMDVTLNRTFKAGNWHPIMLPFSLSETRVEQYFGYGTRILYLDPYSHTMNNRTDEETGKSWTSAVSQALEGTKLSFTLHRYQMLYANTPAFICPTFDWSGDKLVDNNDSMTWEDKANQIKKRQPATDNVKPAVSNGTVTNITFRRVTLDGSNSRNFQSGNHTGFIGYAISNDYEIVGSYDQTTHTGDDIYYVDNVTINGETTAQLVHSNGYNVTMKGTRVWIRPRTGKTNVPPILTVGSRGFSDFEEDSGQAGISDIVADDYIIEGYDMDDDSVYDLMGRKVGHGSLDGLAGGIYIYHGRKVYVK